LRIQRREQAGRLELGGAKGGVHRELRERVGSNILVRDSFQTISGMQPSLATPEGTPIIGRKAAFRQPVDALRQAWQA